MYDASLHPICITSRIEFLGTPRSMSSLRSSKMSSTASAKLFLASSTVFPWPFAPGIHLFFARKEGKVEDEEKLELSPPAGGPPMLRKPFV
jgi:hypothetical protein